MKLTFATGDFFEDAMDFLRESLANYSHEKWKFSVLHAAMALEMALKERLVMINPALALRNIDDDGCEQTVSIRKSVQRLKNLGVSFEKSDEDLSTTVATWRDGVAHHRAPFSHDDAKKKLGAIYKFFTRFVETELGKEIRGCLTLDEYHKYKELLREWEEVVKEAQEVAAEESYEEKIGPRTYDCPECWGTDTVVIREHRGYCHLCNEEFKYENCLRCSEPVFGHGLAMDDGGVLCEGCADWYGAVPIDGEITKSVVSG